MTWSDSVRSMQGHSGMPRAYKPVIIDVRMSDYGYWLVKISTAPGRRMSVMIARVGITPDEAARLALATPVTTPG
jgi:hypothetical protein